MNKAEPLAPKSSAWGQNPEPGTGHRELALPAAMDPDLARLCAIPGDYDLSVPEVAEVIQVDARTVRRMVQRGRIEAKLHQGRGDGKETRMRFSRLSVVLYLVRVSSGDRAAILGSISVQCPQYLKLAQGLCENLGARILAELEGDGGDEVEEVAEAKVKSPAPRLRTPRAKRAAPRKSLAVKTLKKRPETRKRTKRKASGKPQKTRRRGEGRRGGR